MIQVRPACMRFGQNYCRRELAYGKFRLLSRARIRAYLLIHSSKNSIPEMVPLCRESRNLTALRSTVMMYLSDYEACRCQWALERTVERHVPTNASVGLQSQQPKGLYIKRPTRNGHAFKYLISCYQHTSLILFTIFPVSGSEGSQLVRKWLTVLLVNAISLTTPHSFNIKATHRRTNIVAMTAIRSLRLGMP